MNKTKLKELAAKAAGSVKELGLLPTNNRPDYDAQGNFIGMRESLDAKKTVAGAVGTTAVVGGGLAANSAIQAGFGNQGVESWKQAGRYAANEAGAVADKLPGALNTGLNRAKSSWRMTGKGSFGGRVWKAAKAAGRGVAAAFDAKSPKGRLKELAAKAALVELDSIPNAKGQKPEDNWKRAAGIGLLVGGPTGVLLTQPNANESARAGVVYGKRNAAGDVMRTTAGITGGSFAGQLGGMASAGVFSKGGHAGADMGKIMRHVQIGNLAGVTVGLGGGYMWARHANKTRIARAQAAQPA